MTHPVENWKLSTATMSIDVTSRENQANIPTSLDMVRN